MQIKRHPTKYLEDEYKRLVNENLNWEIKELQTANEPVCKVDGREVIMLCANNYLNLSTHPKVVDAMIKATKQYGAGAGSDRSISGNMTIHEELDRRLAKFKDAPASLTYQTGFMANEPEGMFEALKWALQFNLPIIVTENGIEDAEDLVRPSYLIQHIHQIWRGINFNWPIKGYFYWTLVDNFEWERGWSQRFGLWELDIETQARRKRPSADLYAAICKENKLSTDLVEQYAPQIYDRMFPGS